VPVSHIVDYITGVTAATWFISETEEELLAYCHLSDDDRALYETFKHPGRKKHWLACRALLTKLYSPEKPIVVYNAFGKPFLDGAGLHLSMSHAGDYAAVALSNQKIGIDIEKMTSRVERVYERFLSIDEINQLPQESKLEALWLRWCGKEALFKLYGNPETDFRNDIHIHSIKYLCTGGMEADGTMNIRGHSVKCALWFDTPGDYMLAVACETGTPENPVKKDGE
jgi:phosphopantetheinyl transferase